MRRVFTILIALAVLSPVVLVAAMLTRTPASALVVPSIQIATADGIKRLTPEELGVSRTTEGLQVDEARFAARLQAIVAGFGTPATPARYELDGQGVRLVTGTPGLAPDWPATRRAILHALETGRGNVSMPLRQISSGPPPQFAVVVRLPDFRLELFEGTSLVQHYSIGVGALKFPTPPGAYYIRSKSKNPTWRNPGSDWARTLPKRIGPGPKNPLGTRALRLDRQALVIHGTPYPSSVGHRSSHGCIRMRNSDVQDLFDRVPQGTAVFIVP